MLVEKHHREETAEYAAQRMAVRKDERAIKDNEKEQKRRDYYIDQLNEKVKRLKEERDLYQAQYVSQREEQAAARNYLFEAAKECEKI